jgi:hypothetical protein
MKQWIAVVLLVGLCVTWVPVSAQNPTDGNTPTPAMMELVLKNQAANILEAREWQDRLRADSLFTRTLVQTLKLPHSFRYPFDSLGTISVVYAPDSAFRIFSWQLMKDFSFYRQKGAIQYKTANGSLRLTPLFDISPFTEQPCDSVRDASQWIGAVYYKILLNTFQGRNYYTLLGYDENDARSTRKWMEVLTFNEQGQPQFGGDYFQYRPDDMKPPVPTQRFYLEYKKGANARMNFDEELQLITFAHLISENGVPAAHYTLVPEGSYEGFKWVLGKWVHIPVVEALDPNPQINPPKENPAPGNMPTGLPVPKKKKSGTGNN